MDELRRFGGPASDIDIYLDIVPPWLKPQTKSQLLHELVEILAKKPDIGGDK